MRNSLYTVLLIAALFTAASCAPTYPREKIEEAVKELCKKEYNVDVEVKAEGKTLGVRIPLEGLFDKQTLQILPKAFEKIDGVMLSVSRVALSTDSSIDFYTVITYDKAVPGAEVVMTRYVPDLRRYVFGDISRGEFAKRMVFDVRFNPQGIIDTWFGGFTLKDTNFADFLSEQIARRISDEFRERGDLAGKFKVVSVEGKLENRIFNFTVDISREGLPMSELIHGTEWHQKVLELCLQVISYVLYFYDSKDYDKVKICNKFDNKSIEMDGSDIKKWYKRRLQID